MSVPEQPSKPEKISGTRPKKFLRSEDLLGGAREVIIMHGESEYRLQRTKAGKLILTK